MQQLPNFISSPESDFVSSLLQAFTGYYFSYYQERYHLHSLVILFIQPISYTHDAQVFGTTWNIACIIGAEETEQYKQPITLRYFFRCLAKFKVWYNLETHRQTMKVYSSVQVHCW